MARAYIGTSGFSYPEWKGSFYPADLPTGEMLRFYGQVFPTVELNNTFYRLLETRRVALCVAETDEEAQPAEVVGPASYLRLHRSRYADEDLRRWAGWIGDRTAEGRDVFAYFTHEDGAPATEYARQLIQLTASAPRS